MRCRSLPQSERQAVNAGCFHHRLSQGVKSHGCCCQNSATSNLQCVLIEAAKRAAGYNRELAQVYNQERQRGNNQREDNTVWPEQPVI